MSHPEFTVTIKIKGEFPSAIELKAIRKFDSEISDVSVSELKKTIHANGIHQIHRLIKPYVNAVLSELDSNEIEYTIK